MLSKCISNWYQKAKYTNQFIIPKLLYSVSCNTNERVDVAIIGGGIIGYSTAYWLKAENPKLNIAIIEKDKSYCQASTVLSVGGLRQQFSEPENIQMSIFCGQVFSNLEKYFSVGSQEKIDIQFNKRGYLNISMEGKEDILRNNYEMQKKLGASVDFLSHDQMNKKWPWLAVKETECGVYGTDHEGWFDPWLLLCAIMTKVNQMGIQCFQGALKELQGRRGKLECALIQNNSNEEIELKFDCAVNAAGCWASDIATLAEQGTGLSGDEYPLFIKKCKRYVYILSVPNFPQLTMTPMVIDSTGVYFRKENNNVFTCGLSPDEFNEPKCNDLDVDYEWFYENIWPKLLDRVPLMEALKVKSGWAGFYDYNTKDQNLIIGKHPAIENFYLCNGSSGHGLQHALAIGRANMELIIHGKFKTINLDRLNYNRFIKNKLVCEKNIF